MFQTLTYETILKRMTDRVDEEAKKLNLSLDTREGSVIRTALSPAAVELALMYIALGEVLNESFADTESRDFLIRRCSERAITPEPATCAIRKGEFNIDVPIGARFSLNKLNYIAVEKIGAGEYKMSCETAGNIGNTESGALVPIDYINGLTYARLTEVLIPGEDEEDTEHLRQRYFDSISSQAFGGNIRDYKDKTLSIAGVGAVKVFPVWNGGGTVKLVILDSQYKIPSKTLTDEVQTIIDPIPNNGEGMGEAPIGHTVTVKGAGETAVDIETYITYQNGWNFETVKPYAEEAIDLYFEELAKSWADEENLVIRISRLESLLLDLEGVSDIWDTTINGIAQNLTLATENIPIRGDFYA